MNTKALIAISLMTLLVTTVPVFATHSKGVHPQGVDMHTIDVSSNGFMVVVDNMSSQSIYKIKFRTNTGELSFDDQKEFKASSKYYGKRLMIVTKTDPIKHGEFIGFDIKTKNVDSYIIIEWTAYDRNNQKIDQSVFRVK